MAPTNGINVAYTWSASSLETLRMAQSGRNHHQQFALISSSVAPKSVRSFGNQADAVLDELRIVPANEVPPRLSEASSKMLLFRPHLFNQHSKI